MQRIWPALPLLAMGCGSEPGLRGLSETAGAPNPRQLESLRTTDRILQINQPEVDVLWAVDASCSMHDDQMALATHFPIFFDFFDGSGTDYHLGVITTDMDRPAHRGKLITVDGRRFIDPDTPGAEGIFARMMPGIRGDTETGIAATYHALEIEKDEYNVGFLRADSSVHVVVISDEADRSNGQPGITGVEEFSSYLRGLRRDPDNVTFSSITQTNSAYKLVTDKVGGIHRSIDGSDWEEVLEQLGLQAAGLRREYYLSALPVPGSIDVEVEEDGSTATFAEGHDWEYDAVRNSIRFHSFVPKPYSEVLIHYTVLADHHGD